MFAAAADTAGFAPHNGNLRQATGAPGYFAVTPPMTTASPASVAAAIAARMVFGEARRSSLGPAVLRTIVATSRASSVIATHQCATVAAAWLCILTGTPPSLAAASTATTAPNADRMGPSRPATPTTRRSRQATIANATTETLRIDARYRCV